ncbi:MAG: Cu(I)/Ag(I) efflux system membrane fusion protein [Gammaproteobacteria bacterium]|jgi:Cu(I)/Ag(I) efflux system membrane fusion protein
MNIKIIITAIIAVVIGLGAGYLIFGNTADSASAMDTPEHNMEASPPGSEEIWTCSMHPQVQQNEPGDCPLCGMDLIPLEANTSNDPLVLEMTSEAVKLANIQTTIIGEAAGQSGQTIRLSGKVQPDERLASSQVAHVPGRIEKLFVSFTGEQVSKGQKIATLYSPELITAQRELLEALKLQALNPGLLEAARNKLRYWKIGNATIESIEQNGTIQETFTVYADASGIVTNKRVSVGDYIKKGEPLFELMSLRKVWVLFDAYEADLSAINIGDKIEFTAPSIADKVFKTRVTFIDPMINPSTRVASIRTEVQNSKGLLKPEMLVYGTLQKKSNTTVQLSIPKSAVLWTGKRSVVYVKVPDMTVPSFQFREVGIGEAQGNTYQILDGLEVGEEVVTYGSFTIDAAAQLNNQASMMNRNVKVKNESSLVMLPDYTETTPVQFKKQLADVSTAYILLKDALVATDNEQAITGSNKIRETLAKVDMSLVKSDAYLYWMQQLETIQGHNKKISSSMDIEEQRKQFNFLSQALIKSIKVFGVPEDTLYVQHCPMVNNNEGADWLSREAEIRNPYFGDKMMKCGAVKNVITAQ